MLPRRRYEGPHRPAGCVAAEAGFGGHVGGRKTASGRKEMTTRFELCPIWASNAVTGEKHEAYGYYDPQTRVLHVEHSARAAGGFVLPEVVLNSTLIHMSDEQRARLTTWLIDQRNQGNG